MNLSIVTPVYNEQDRQAAIHYAVQKAQDRDIVLIAGKGHEAYQLVKGIRYPFDDALIVQQLLSAPR